MANNKLLMANNKLLILDKDGTLTTTVSGKKFVSSPVDQKVIPGMDSALIYANKKGYTIAVASNQGGIKAGHKTKLDTIKEFNVLHVLYPEISVSLFCPDDGETVYKIDYEFNSSTQIARKDLPFGETQPLFRKPQAGMLEFLVSDLLPLEAKLWDNVLYIGDRHEDEAAAIDAGITFIWADVFAKDYQRFLCRRS